MDHLTDLKSKLEKNKDIRNRAVERYHEADHALSENEDKLKQKVATLLEKEKLELVGYREVIKDSIDQLNYQQQQNNDFLAELNNNLNDMSDLKAIYETKREIMEQNHQEFVRSLESKENKLKRKINDHSYKLKKIEQEYNELSLRKETKKQLLEKLKSILNGVDADKFTWENITDLVEEVEKNGIESEKRL